MSNPKWDVSSLVAIDTHVHVESDVKSNAADEAAKKYFGDSGVTKDRQELASYYRSRKIGCVVFSVDEQLTGRPPVPNEEVGAFAAANSDVVMAFASVNPKRGVAGAQEAER